MKFAFALVALAAVAAPVFAMEDMNDAPAPEATPAIQSRLFENLDESHYLSARDVANVEESSSSAAVFGVAVPCVAAAVGVAGFVAYKKRQAPAQSATLSA